VAHEVLERVRLAVLLAHEQQRHVAREQEQRRRELLALERHERGEALAERAVAHLVVVLRRDDERERAMPVEARRPCRRSRCPE
jgi:hypothetical protein